MINRAGRAAGMLLLVLGLASCDSDLFVIPPAEEVMMEDGAEMMDDDKAMMDDKMMTMMASDLECETGSPMLAVTEDGSRLRTGPGTTYPVRGLAYTGDTYPATRVSDDGTWVEVIYMNGRKVWLASELGKVTCN